MALLINTVCVYIYIYIYPYVYIYLNRSLLSRMSLCGHLRHGAKNYTGALKSSYTLLCSTAHGNKIYSFCVYYTRIYMDPYIYA